MGLLSLLLDTHCWLWFHWNADRLPSPLKRTLRRASTSLYLSTVSLVEISIKHASAKLRLPVAPAEFVTELLRESVQILPVQAEHALRLGALPLHHRDPFDRLLVAQAQVEGFTLVTADPQILQYDVKTIDARK